MENEEFLRLLVLKCMCNDERNPKFLKEEGSWAINPFIIEKRINVLRRLLLDDHIFPYEGIVRAVDICVFVCKEVLNGQDVSYKLFKRVYKMFVGDNTLDMQIAEQALLQICKEHYLNPKKTKNFFCNFKKCILKNDNKYYIASCHIRDFLKLPFSIQEREEIINFINNHSKELLD